MLRDGGSPLLTLMLWRLKTLWRLSGGVCRELAGDWYSMGLVSVGELAHRPSGTCGRAGEGAGSGAAQAQNKATGGLVRTDGQTEQTTRGRAAFAPGSASALVPVSAAGSGPSSLLGSSSP